MKNTIALVLVVFCSIHLFNWQYSRIDRMATYKINGYSTKSQTMIDLECLSQAVYYESAGEDFASKVAVAQVIINRKNSKRFSNSICGVVYQKSQFSFTIEKPRKLVNVNKKVYAECYEVAKTVLLENFRLNSVKNALWYHTKQISPNWNKNMTKVAVVGNHIFYTN